MNNAPPARPAISARPPAAPPKPAPPTVRIGKAAPMLPPRIILNAMEGWGKTSLAANAPEPVILMARGETGFETLRGHGRVPDVDCGTIGDWPSLLGYLDSLSQKPLHYKTIVLDALGGYERLCWETVVRRDFKGNWGDDGFFAFQKGPGLAVRDWLELLPRLDVLNRQGAMILILSHATVGPFRNPTGRDYDRYQADCRKETWAATVKWADAVLFGAFEQMLVDVKGASKPKASDRVSDRVLHTTRTEAWDAKNRYGLPDSIDIPNDPMRGWETLSAALIAGKGVI